MDGKKNINHQGDNRVNEPSADYEKAEMDLLRDALNRTYTDRFLFTTRLYKIQETFKRAKITHKPYNLDK